jgi:DNA-3-methyladenine glycosylase
VTTDLLNVLARSAPEVAPLLLGATLRVRGVSVRHTEVEASQGSADPGSHAFRGETPRNRVMFGPAGHLYMYFTYGMHVCANVVCGPTGTASAVLLRAGRITDGIEAARVRRTTSRTDDDLARGPARLTVALGLTLDDNGVALDGGEVVRRLPDGPDSQGGPGAPGAPAGRIRTGPRTGVSGEGGDGDRFPWRFWLDGDPTVSPYRPATPKNRRR